ncbi:MAG: winged helix-turn-helix transcriptional regulator [Candidatus Aenigmarchaeota archaeon]|nr:winged helix-turn-helix transcriptional regulator [Candidatus Aenigmarchaeota archaeon]
MESRLILNRTKTDIRILSALLKGERMTAREIAEDLKTSVPRVRSNLQGLIKDNLVIAFRKHPKQHFYQANMVNILVLKFAELHYAEQSIKGVPKALVNPISFLKTRLSLALGSELLLIVLFGSSVRRLDFNDVDICVVLDRIDDNALSTVKKVLDALQERYRQFRFSIQPFSEREMKERVRNNDPLVRNILNGIPIRLGPGMDRRIEDLVSFPQKFVEMRMVHYFEQVWGPILKAISMLVKCQEAHDEDMFSRAKKELLFGIVLAKGNLPEDAKEAHDVLKREWPRLERDLEEAFSEKNVVEIISTLSRHGIW